MVSFTSLDTDMSAPYPSVEDLGALLCEVNKTWGLDLVLVDRSKLNRLKHAEVELRSMRRLHGIPMHKYTQR